MLQPGLLVVDTRITSAMFDAARQLRKSVDIWSLAAFAFLYGVFYGGWVAGLPAVVMDYFGSRNVSSTIGLLYTSVAFGTLIGPSAAGFAFDLSHSYTLPIMAGANVAAAVIVAAMSGTIPRQKL